MPPFLEHADICSLKDDQDIQFDCNDEDLNDFFNNDAKKYQEGLLAKTYCFIVNDEIISMVSICNDKIEIKREEKIKVYPESKRIRYYPGILVARLGVQKKYQGQGKGSEILNFIKVFFLVKNKTGCRYITVDAYNKERVIQFYQRNGFNLFHAKDAKKTTRQMYYDLIEYSNQLKDNPALLSKCENVYVTVDY